MIRVRVRVRNLGLGLGVGLGFVGLGLHYTLRIFTFKPFETYNRRRVHGTLQFARPASFYAFVFCRSFFPGIIPHVEWFLSGR